MDEPVKTESEPLAQKPVLPDPDAVDENPEEAETVIEGDLDEMDIDRLEPTSQQVSEQERKKISDLNSDEKSESLSPAKSMIEEGEVIEDDDEDDDGEIGEDGEEDQIEDGEEDDEDVKSDEMDGVELANGTAHLSTSDDSDDEVEEEVKVGQDEDEEDDEKEEGEINSADDFQPEPAKVKSLAEESSSAETSKNLESSNDVSTGSVETEESDKVDAIEDVDRIAKSVQPDHLRQTEEPDEIEEHDDLEETGEQEEREEPEETEEQEDADEEEDEEGVEADDEDAEGDVDDENGSPTKSKRKRVVDEDDNEERAQKRKAAVSSLTEIEVEFAKLRDRLREDKVTRLQAEIDMCLDGTHPELSSFYDEIAQTRDERIQLADAHIKYRRRCVENQTRAIRTHIHQQYFKNVANLRADMIKQTTETWYRVNRERRAMDALVPFYGYKIPEKRSVQYRQRQAQYNEIAILVGLSKYVGFPAAPEITAASTDEVTEDMDLLRAARSTMV
ncbi:Sds3-like-domain-containing protein [Lipomyces arxii]|uniref:Sds3-like-domain-containing protein n=1 Tax=Lipomyces arxii TaxID=56418 RepID=UPI0034CD1BD1